MVSSKMSHADGAKRVREVFDRVVEEGWRPETSAGASDEKIDQVMLQQRVAEIPESVREVLRLIGGEPGLWSAGSFFGIANMNGKFKRAAQSMLADRSSSLGDGSDLFVLFGHGGYEFHVISGSDLGQPDPPVWLLRELYFEDEEGSAVRIEKFWDSVSQWFEFLGSQVIRFRESFADEATGDTERLARYFRL